MRGSFGSRGQKARRHAVVAAAGDHEIHGLQESGVFELGWNTHRNRQVVVPHPGNVDSWNRHNVIEILESLYRFQKKDHNRLLVRLCKELCSARLVEIVCYTEGNATPAERRIFQLRDNLFRLGSGFHSWDHYATYSDVQDPR